MYSSPMQSTCSLLFLFYLLPITIVGIKVKTYNNPINQRFDISGDEGGWDTRPIDKLQKE